jgi:hypothetical protein
VHFLYPSSGTQKKERNQARAKALATKLDSIEKLLQEVLVATKAKTQP